MESDFNAVQTGIAHQVHITKPDHLKPGRDVFMLPSQVDANEVIVIVDYGTVGRAAVVRYDAGPNTYTVKLTEDGREKELRGVYCDQLGELIFGGEAKPFQGVMVEVITDENDPRFRRFFGC